MTGVLLHISMIKHAMGILCDHMIHKRLNT